MYTRTPSPASENNGQLPRLDLRYNTNDMKKRVLIIDCLRAFAIFSMIAYHLAYDLQTYYSFQINVHDGLWKIFEQIVAGLFLLLVGWSFLLSWKRTPHWKKYVKRGATIFGYGLIVSAATFLFDPATYVRFGILHLIGASVIMLPLFVRLRQFALIPGTLAAMIGMQLRDGTASTPLFLPIGLTEPGFQSIDYFPLFPWYGAVLLGVTIGFVLQNLPASEPAKGKLKELITMTSRYSLSIYLLHQPILLIVLRMALGKPYH